MSVKVQQSHVLI